ncbi:siphovirus ReqiPepy6 Gp37-like family protein [Umezawaea sp. Da 62-37]|uniref:siphovirus ReqiPepy6 Gp37-like family protein n=1 Tax=Umezawaea sp. Da 62-37 TaxID=3075927 RepID=UPI0028F7055D|nr:siphovirus ReqiPepy6 Gp37-like family protein [Umezawaea sp. Da 62-37]WNV90317.1 siphovirus ReqiPepy6 Gp37-like family protein [Umezawaea sp. Da 62-37]
MRLTDLTVEVRDRDLTRLGLIRPEELNLRVQGEHNGLGVWKLELPAEHPLAAPLRQPGSGIIVTGPQDILMSGPTVSPVVVTSADDPTGMVSFEGVSDSVVLADMLAWPQPTNPDPTTQAASHDVRSGNAESVIHGYVNANCGPSAPTARRKAHLVMGTNLGRGPLVKKSARFPVLGALISEIAVMANLGFRVVQRGANLAFETYQVTDRSLDIRLDVLTGTLASQSVAVAPPGVTRVIVGGQGELENRDFLSATTAEAVAAEEEWGRRIERFVDQRQTDDPAEYQQAADEVLAEEGFTAVAMRAVPVDDLTMRFGVDWYLGDRVSAVVGAGELSAVATGYVLVVGAGGVQLGATLGDPRQFDRNESLTRRLDDARNRISALERNAEVGTTAADDAAIMNMMGVW